MIIIIHLIVINKCYSIKSFRKFCFFAILPKSSIFNSFVPTLFIMLSIATLDNRYLPVEFFKQFSINFNLEKERSVDVTVVTR